MTLRVNNATASIMVLAFLSPFTLSDVRIVKKLDPGLAVTVLFDVRFIWMLLVPALIRL